MEHGRQKRDGWREQGGWREADGSKAGGERADRSGAGGERGGWKRAVFGLLVKVLEKGVEAAKTHVNLVTENLSNDVNPTTRLLKGMGLAGGLPVQMTPMDASAFRQVLLATYQASVIPPAAPPPAPVIPPAAPPPAPVIGAAASPAVDPPQLQLSPGSSAGPASYQPKQFPFGTIYNNIRRNQARLPWGEFKRHGRLRGAPVPGEIRPPCDLGRELTRLRRGGAGRRADVDRGVCRAAAPARPTENHNRL